MLQALAKLILRIGGWTPVLNEDLPSRAIFIAAPHTSNWDAFWALTYKVAIRLDVHWFAKDSLFWFPLSALLRSLGGVPLDRQRAGAAVEQAVALFRENERYYFGLAPEGTRSRTDYWKTGFYRIAQGAEVPVVLGFIDYGNRRLGIGPMLTLSGDREKDLAYCRNFYAEIEGRWPDKVSPVEFPPRDGGRSNKSGRD